MRNPDTPVIIGVGQSGDRVDSPNYHAWSASDLAAAAARYAIADAGAGSDLLPAIDAIGATRTFEDSFPHPAPFGKSSCLPRSVTHRLGIDPAYAVWAKGGGNSPQDLVAEFCTRIAAGEFKLALITGAEAISTVRDAQRNGRQLDFAETPAGSVEDRGSGFEEFIDPLAERHGITSAPVGYALAETARRARLGLTPTQYARQMGELFSPFAAIASRNPRAAWNVPAYTPEELVTVGPQNRWIAQPYPLRLVARDQVNLGASILIASVATARELGVPESKFVYLHGYARAVEKPLLERPDIGSSPAAQEVAAEALRMAGVSIGQVAKFDFYSCFPIAVSNVACDRFGVSADDPRQLTVTGGLPCFGGPGNNYSMHAIAEMVEALRRCPGTYGFVGANGGILSKYSAGVYSTTAREWVHGAGDGLQSALDGVQGVPLLTGFAGHGIIETYTVCHDKGKPTHAVVIGRDSQGRRFIARADWDDGLLTMMEANDQLGRRVLVETWDSVNRFTLEP